MVNMDWRALFRFKKTPAQVPGITPVRPAPPLPPPKYPTNKELDAWSAQLMGWEEKPHSWIVLDSNARHKSNWKPSTDIVDCKFLMDFMIANNWYFDIDYEPDPKECCVLVYEYFPGKDGKPNTGKHGRSGAVGGFGFERNVCLAAYKACREEYLDDYS